MDSTIRRLNCDNKGLIIKKGGWLVIMEIEYTPEQIKELETKAALAEQLAQEKERVEAERNGVVEEMKELRTKKQELEDLIKSGAENRGAADPAQLAKEAVEAVLRERESKQIEMTRVEFEAKFKASNPEFQSSNDVGGLKWEAFKKVLNRFNLSGLSKESDFAEIYSDAMSILKKADNKKPDTQVNPYSFTPTSRGTPGQASDSDLSPAENRLLEKTGYSKEQWLKIKAKQPSFAQQILESVR